MNRRDPLSTERSNETPRPVTIKAGTSGFSEHPARWDHEHTFSHESMDMFGNLPHRNLLDNAFMEVVQRGLSALTITNTTGVRNADRWQVDCIGGGGFSLSTTVEADAPVEVPSTRSLKLTAVGTFSQTASQYCLVRQNLEANRMQSVNFGSQGNPLTISFWVKATVPGLYFVELENISASRRICRPYTITTANTWQRVVVTFPPDRGTSKIAYTNNYGFSVLFWMAADNAVYGSADHLADWATWASSAATRTKNQVNAFATNGNSFWLTAAQLEVGTVATPLDYIHRQHTIMRCRRYLYVLGGNNVSEAFGTGMCISTTDTRIFIPMGLPMRTTLPSPSYSGNLRLVDANAATYVVNGIGLSTAGTSANWIQLTVTSATAFVAGRAAWLSADNDLNARLFISSEASP